MWSLDWHKGTDYSTNNRFSRLKHGIGSYSRSSIMHEMELLRVLCWIVLVDVMIMYLFYFWDFDCCNRGEGIWTLHLSVTTFQILYDQILDFLFSSISAFQFNEWVVLVECCQCDYDILLWKSFKGKVLNGGMQIQIIFSKDDLGNVWILLITEN